MIFQIFSGNFRKFSFFSWFSWFSWFLKNFMIFHDFHDFFMKNQKISKSPKFFAFYLESSKNVLQLRNLLGSARPTQHWPYPCSENFLQKVSFFKNNDTLAVPTSDGDSLVHTLKVWTSVDKNRPGVSQKPNHQKPIPFVFYLHHDGCLTEF